MRLSIVVLGWELLAVELGTPEAADEEPLADGGYLTSTPISFVSSHELPDGSGLPYREGWE